MQLDAPTIERPSPPVRQLIPSKAALIERIESLRNLGSARGAEIDRITRDLRHTRPALWPDQTGGKP